MNITGFEMIGDQDRAFSGTSTIVDGVEGAIAFCVSSKFPDLAATVSKSRASVVITETCIDKGKLSAKDMTVVLVDRPKEVYLRILEMCFPAKRPEPGVHPTAVVDDEAIIDPTAHVGAKCVIGKCRIGARTVIHPGVIINDNVVIGRNVTISPGTVIGFDGFGYYKDKDGTQKNFPHYGGVLIEDDVEIGSNTSVDSGTLGNTILKKGSKIDNLCHIAHNVVIGENSLVIANAMIGGSTVIKESAWIAPSATLRDGIEIGKGALVGLGAVVLKNVPDDTVVVGNPAKPLPEKKDGVKVGHEAY